MHIVHLCSELAPIAKVGGLADVIYSLSKALVSEGHRVDVILPKYDCLDYSSLKNLKIDSRTLWSYEGYQRFNNTVWHADLEGINVFLIEPHHPSHYFSRGTIYSCHDDIARFIYFSRAALEYLFKTEKPIDVIHVHDWPTALGVVLYREMYISLGMKKCRSVLTIHNMEYQGKCSPDDISKAGLMGESYLTQERMLDPIFPMTINLLKGGIEYADAITTVSPTYEKEIVTSEGAFGLTETLQKNKYKLSGILNGIDINFWNPATDPHLVQHYSAADEPNTKKAAKNLNRQKLYHLCGLNASDGPIVACITRLVPQKGPTLIREALLHTKKLGGQFILLGSCASPEIHQEFLSLQKEFKGQGIAISLAYNEALAHVIYAAADMLVIPSIFEPCGLTQMIALRYGTVPIVRKTGGLADTVFDIDNSDIPLEKRNGFSFEAPEPKAIDHALNRAFQCYQQSPKLWEHLIENGMRCDYSWRHSAQEYVQIYTQTENNTISC